MRVTKGKATSYGGGDSGGMVGRPGEKDAVSANCVRTVRWRGRGNGIQPLGGCSGPQFRGQWRIAYACICERKHLVVPYEAGKVSSDCMLIVCQCTLNIFLVVVHSRSLSISLCISHHLRRASGELGWRVAQHSHIVDRRPYDFRPSNHREGTLYGRFT